MLPCAEALATGTISRDTARRLGDLESETAAINIVGIALRELRRFEDAITIHQDAAAIFQETGDRRGEGTALTNLGQCAAADGPV